MLESVSTDSRHYPQERGARFAEGGGRFTGMPRMTPPAFAIALPTGKLRALCWVLALGLSQLPAGSTKSNLANALRR